MGGLLSTDFDVDPDWEGMRAQGELVAEHATKGLDQAGQHTVAAAGAEGQQLVDHAADALGAAGQNAVGAAGDKAIQVADHAAEGAGAAGERIAAAAGAAGNELVDRAAEQAGAAGSALVKQAGHQAHHVVEATGKKLQEATLIAGDELRITINWVVKAVMHVMRQFLWGIPAVAAMTTATTLLAAAICAPMLPFGLLIAGIVLVVGPIIATALSVLAVPVFLIAATAVTSIIAAGLAAAAVLLLTRLTSRGAAAAWGSIRGKLPWMEGPDAFIHKVAQDVTDKVVRAAVQDREPAEEPAAAAG